MYLSMAFTVLFTTLQRSVFIVKQNFFLYVTEDTNYDLIFISCGGKYLFYILLSADRWCWRKVFEWSFQRQYFLRSTFFSNVCFILMIFKRGTPMLNYIVGHSLGKLAFRLHTALIPGRKILWLGVAYLFSLVLMCPLPSWNRCLW